MTREPHPFTLPPGVAAERAILRAEQLRRIVAFKFSNVTEPLAIARPCPVATAPARPGDRRRFATGRDPCPRCGTRADLGCRHLQPSGE